MTIKKRPSLVYCEERDKLSLYYYYLHRVFFLMGGKVDHLLISRKSDKVVVEVEKKMAKFLAPQIPGVNYCKEVFLGGGGGPKIKMCEKNTGKSL